ncbi:hypothetical protein F5Y14DRAFT_59400 [Nemania sp. NC0429]|nr:hypothetical protein F5Y14DRAFT_59400 [Nemania sp. NC0429]
MSGVRNLRAMFEQKGDSLPDRGRSPGPGGFATPSPSASPRPLSKVRTNFVAIEKDGKLGLRRDPSGDSASVSSRRLSDDTDIPSSQPQLQPASERPDNFSDNLANVAAASLRMNLSQEVIPESPRQDTPVNLSPKQELKPSPFEPNANPDKLTDEEEPQTKMLTGDPTDASAAQINGTILNEGIGEALNGTSPTATKAKVLNVTKPASKTAAAAPLPSAKAAPKAPKSPMAAKPVNGREPAKAPSSSTNPKRAIASKTMTSKPAPVDVSPSGTGFVKPKPKSPTRPVKLPSSLTTHTTSSAQKLGNGSVTPLTRQSLSRASGNINHLSVNPAMHRSPSRNSVSTAGGALATRTLKHKSSSVNVGRPRPSLGPPPKQATKDQAPPKKEAHIDESFLARMMRPTQSSAKKTSEKVPISPPRKYNVPIRKPDTKDAEKSTKKMTPKIQASSTQVKTAKGSVKPVAAKDTTQAAAQAETATVALQGATPSNEITEAPTHNDEKVVAQPTAEAVSTIVTGEEPAKDNIETAKTATDIGISANNTSAEESGVPEVQPILEPALAAKVHEAELPVPVPAVSADPLKQVDIEDTIQERHEPSHDGLHSLEPAAKASKLAASKLEEVVTRESGTASPDIQDLFEAVDKPLKENKTGFAAREITGSTTTETTLTETWGTHSSTVSTLGEESTRDGEVATF